jgi:hypothetical protein
MEKARRGRAAAISDSGTDPPTEHLLFNGFNP